MAHSIAIIPAFLIQLDQILHRYPFFLLPASPAVYPVRSILQRFPAVGASAVVLVPLDNAVEVEKVLAV